VPGRRRLENTSWNVETGHVAKRFQLFIIIALGESIVITRATTADHRWLPGQAGGPVPCWFR
jgi:low temperature requirement protein LtrA